MGRCILTVKFLEHCEPGELVRAFFTQHGEWGIVGYLEDGNRQRKNAVVVISKDKDPLFISPQEIEQVAGLPCLSYGKEFDLLPEYAEPCELFRPGQGSSVPGTLIYACPVGGDGTTERYLMAQGSIILHLDTFRVTVPAGGLGGNRAGFQQWSIWMMLPPHPNRPTRVFEYGQHNPQAI